MPKVALINELIVGARYHFFAWACTQTFLSFPKNSLLLAHRSMHPRIVSRIRAILIALFTCSILVAVAYLSLFDDDESDDLVVPHPVLHPSVKNNMKGGANDTCPALVKATKLQSFNLDNIHTYLSGPSTNHTSPTDKVLILTPLMDAVPFLERYFSKLATIDYPKELLSLGFLVSTAPDQDVDPTLQAVEKHTSQLDNSSDYRRITLLQQKSKSTQRYEERHEYDRQTKRRQILARCRNALVTTALLDESWVLWLDVDVVEYAPTLLLELMRFNKDIIAPNCFRKIQSWPTTKNESYDRNNWIETTESLAEQQVLDEDDILYEGEHVLILCI